jgi:hypothetical protein
LELTLYEKRQRCVEPTESEETDLQLFISHRKAERLNLQNEYQDFSASLEEPKEQEDYESLPRKSVRFALEKAAPKAPQPDVADFAARGESVELTETEETNEKVIEPASVKEETQSFGVVMVLLSLLALLVAGWVSHWPLVNVANVLCGPVPPGTIIEASSPPANSGAAEAPWWAPESLKPQVFAIICGSRPRTSLVWSFGQKNHRLKMTFRNLENDNVLGTTRLEICRNHYS